MRCALVCDIEFALREEADEGRQRTKIVPAICQGQHNQETKRRAQRGNGINLGQLGKLGIALYMYCIFTRGGHERGNAR